MRALHVFPLFGHGSVAEEEGYARQLTKALRGLDVQGDVLNGDTPSLSFLARTWSMLAHNDVVLMAFAPVPVTSAVMRLARMRRKPVVILPSLYGDLPRDARSLGGILESAAAALTVTEESARELSRAFPKLKVFDIGVGVDPNTFDDSAISGARFRAKYDLENRQFLFTLGHVRHDLAIEAMYFFPPGSLMLVIADQDRGGKLPSDRVRFLGPLSAPDLRDAYDACDVFVYPSPDEKLGGMFLEAWARGKPVIGNPNSNAVSSLIDDAVDGFLCDNSRTVSRRVELLLEHPALRRKMGDKGRRKLLEHYTWEQVAKRVRGIYESTAAKCAIPKLKTEPRR